MQGGWKGKIVLTLNFVREIRDFSNSKIEKLEETQGFMGERLVGLICGFFLHSLILYVKCATENRVNCSPRAIKYTVVKFLTCMHKIALIRNSKKLDIPIACVKLPVGCSSPPPPPPSAPLFLRNFGLFLGYLDYLNIVHAFEIFERTGGNIF